MSESPEDDSLLGILRTGVVLAVIVVTLCSLLGGASQGISAALGALVMLVNFALIRGLGKKLLDQGVQKKYWYASLFAAKFLGLLAAIFVLMSLLGVEIIGFGLGISVVFGAVVVEALRHAV